MPIQVRALRDTDIPAVTPLVRDYWTFENIEGFDSVRIESLLAMLLAHPDRGTCWVAADGPALCGYLLAVYMFSLEHGGTMAEIDELFVLPHYRSAGAGGALLHAAEQFLKERSCVRIQLQLGAANERARAFYSRHGYQPRSGFELLDKGLA